MNHINGCYTNKRKENLFFIWEKWHFLKIKHKKNILVAIDTSGSVSSDNLVEFLGQLLHIHKTGHEVTVMECDAKITNIFKYKGDKEIAITGRGGTDFQPAIDYFNQHIQTYNTLV